MPDNTHDTNMIVSGWFNDKLKGGALARDTDAYNQVFSALPDLVTRLGGASVPAQAAADTGATNSQGKARDAAKAV